MIGQRLFRPREAGSEGQVSLLYRTGFRVIKSVLKLLPIEVGTRLQQTKRHSEQRAEAGREEAPVAQEDSSGPSVPEETNLLEPATRSRVL